MSTRPHDALFKWFFEAPGAAAALVRELVPLAVREAIRWDTVAHEPGSFIDAALADRHSDRLFVARLRRGDPELIYLLLEHQSTEDPALPLRVLEYQLQIWARFRKVNPGGRLPPIVTLVVSHAQGGWTVARALEELFDPAVLAIPGLAGLVPRCSMIVDDLAQVTDAALAARSLDAPQQVALWLLRDSRDPARLLERFDAWLPALTAAGAEHWPVMITYLLRVIDPVYKDALRAKLAKLGPRAEEVTMTIAEYLHAEGRAEGQKQGLAEGLRRLLLLKFQALDPEAEARLQAATPEALDRYLGRVLTADSLAAVFAD